MPSTRPSRVLYLLIGLAFALGFTIWIGVGLHFDINEPWDRPRSNAAWIQMSLLVSFLLGLFLPLPQTGTKSPASRFPEALMPFAIGMAIGLGASVAMLFRSSGLSLWVLGAITMGIFGMFFGLAALVSWALRRFVAARF
jgi:hypothetical protein